VFLFYAFRSLMARRRANLLTLLSVASFVAGSLIGLTIYSSLRRELVSKTPKENVLVLSKGAPMELASAIALEDTNRIMLRDGIRKSDGKPLATREMVGAVNLSTVETLDAPSVIRGIDAMSIPTNRVTIVEGAAPAEGSLEVIVGRKLVKKYPYLKVGSDLYLPGGPSKIVGVFFADGGVVERELWTPRPALERHLKRQVINSMTLTADSPSQMTTLIEELNSAKDVQVFAFSVSATRAQNAGLGKILRIVLLILILLGVVASVAIAATMSASISVRLPEMAALVAIGIRRSRLSRMVLAESMLLSTAGTLLGLAGAELIRRALDSVPIDGYPIVLVAHPMVFVVGLAIGVVVGVMGGLGPFFKLNRLDISATLR
jgi:putative ABC transport system permease protein